LLTARLPKTIFVTFSRDTALAKLHSLNVKLGSKQATAGTLASQNA
jgi:hypothetical protein